MCRCRGAQERESGRSKVAGSHPAPAIEEKSETANRCAVKKNKRRTHESGGGRKGLNIEAFFLGVGILPEPLYGITFAFNALAVILLNGQKQCFGGGPWAHFLFTGDWDMRTAPDKVLNLIEPAVSSLGFEFVGAEYLPSGKHSVLRIYIDHENGVTLDDCAKVSHQVSGILDVEDIIRGQYNLEVSSPGLDRPLFTKAHFQKFVGSQVKLVLAVAVDGRRKFQGILEQFDGVNVVLDVDGSTVELPFENIDRANLIPVF